MHSGTSLLGFVLFGVLLVASAAPVSAQSAEWLTLTRAETQKVQQTVLAMNLEPGCSVCTATGQWDANWESWLNKWTAGWDYQTLNDGKLNGQVLGQLGFTRNANDKWIIIMDADPTQPAEWLTLTQPEVLKVQQAMLAINAAPGCSTCTADGQWNASWEAWQNGWTAGWGYRTLSAGRLNGQVLGQLGFVRDSEGRWLVIDDQPHLGEPSGWITLSSSETDAVQRALVGVGPAFAGSTPSGVWDHPWATAVATWSQHDPAFQGAALLDERRVSPALLDRLGFTRNVEGGWVLP